MKLKDKVDRAGLVSAGLHDVSAGLHDVLGGIK